MPEEATLECPNCGKPVQLGAVMCENCGINLKSGETYDSQVKRARGRTRHKKAYTGGLYVGIVLGFALLLFSGYMYQRKVEETLGARPDLFQEPVTELQRVRDMMAAGNHQGAAGRASALAQQLEEQAGEIRVATPFGGDDDHLLPHEREEGPEYDHAVARRQLLNLKAKAEALAQRATKAS